LDKVFRPFRIATPPPTEKIKAARWYHGTQTKRKAFSILEKGILPNRKSEWSGDAAPMKGYVYITKELRLALCYAVNRGFDFYYIDGGDITEYIYQYGMPFYLFVIDGNDLVDVNPDEDWILKAIRDRKFDWLNELAMHISRTEGWRIYGQITEDAEWITESSIAFAKRLFEFLTDEQKIQLADTTKALSHKGPIMPIEAWTMNRNDVPRLLTKTGSNFFQVATRIL
jgi:hypothetical protein